MQPSVLTRKRDECFLEYIIFKKDDQGRDAAVIVRKPVDIPECPPLPHELKTKREKVTTVMVVRASDMHPNATQLFMVTECENKGLTASTKYCKKLLKALKDVSLSADAKRISTTISTPGFVEQSRRGEPQVFGDNIKPWVPTGIRNSCTSCTRPFRAGHRRRHCQLCGDVFCSKCLVRRAGIRQEKNAITNYIAMANQRTFRVAQTLYCKVCVTRSREEDAEALQEQTEGARRSLASSKSSSVPHRSSMGSSTQPRNSRCSTPTSSAQRSSLAQQPDVARRNATWIEENRSSWWSENDSETGSWKSGSGRFSNISRNYSGAPTVRSSLSSDYSHGRNSFMAVQSLQTPREVDNEQGDDRIDERRSSIYEVIDTKDMLSESELRRRKHSSVSASSDDMSSLTVQSAYSFSGGENATPMTLVLDGRLRVFRVLPSGISSMARTAGGWSLGDYTATFSEDAHLFNVDFFVFADAKTNRQTDRQASHGVVQMRRVSLSMKLEENVGVGAGSADPGDLFAFVHGTVYGSIYKMQRLNLSESSTVDRAAVWREAEWLALWKLQAGYIALPRVGFV
ncbi:hypothetical protein ON010_g10963 [Phytophthora cinnamomi]|nr:hypothetical protein ON010_g10963 [Phytophthora cinnamomi]